MELLLPLSLQCDSFPSPQNSLDQHAQACPASRLRVTAPTAGLTIPNTPGGRAHMSPGWTRTLRQLLPLSSPWAPLHSHRVVCVIDGGHRGVFGQPLGRVGLSQHLPAFLQSPSP